MYVVEVVDCGDDGVQAVSDALTVAQLPLTTVVVLPARGRSFLFEHGLPRAFRRLRRRDHRHRRRRPGPPQRIESGAIARV